MSEDKLRVAVVSFSFPRDFPRLLLALETLFSRYEKVKSIFPNVSFGWGDVYVCIESKHEELFDEFPREVNKIVEDFNRNGHLNGYEAILGEQRVFNKIFDEYGYDVILKMDSDAFVFRPEAFLSPIVFSDAGTSFVRRKYKEGEDVVGFGCAYMFTKLAFKCVNDTPEGVIKSLSEKYNGAEDLVLTSIFTSNKDIYSCYIDKRKVWWCTKPYRHSDIILAHTGYVDNNRVISEIRKIFGYDVSEIDGYKEILDMVIQAGYKQLTSRYSENGTRIHSGRRVLYYHKGSGKDSCHRNRTIKTEEKI